MTDINLKGGKLSIEQLNTIFGNHPVEFDFIDENDIIRWSSILIGIVYSSERMQT